MRSTLFTEADAALLARVRSGDSRAEDAAVRRWEPYVRKVARCWYVPGAEPEWDELEAVLRITLLLCCRGWRPDREAQFLTYLHRSLENRAIKLRRNWHHGGLQDLGGDVPSVSSLDVPITNEWGVIEARVVDLLSSTIDVQEEATRGALLRQTRERVLALLHKVPVKVGEAAVLYFGLRDGCPLSQTQIAAVLGVSQMQVSRYLTVARRVLAADAELRELWGR